MSFFNPLSPYQSAPMQFFVEAFESTAALSELATIFTEQTTVITADADAVLYVTKEQLRNIFKFQTDATDITDAIDGSGNFENEDIKFYTDHANGFTNNIALGLNPANAVVTSVTAVVSTDATTGGASYPSDKMMVAHDFVRHMAEDMFTTPYAVDLFDNERDVLNNIRTVCGLGSSAGGQKYVLQNISDKILAVSLDGSAAALELDADNAKYMPNEDVLDGSMNINLGRVLFSQMLADVTRIKNWLDPSNVALTGVDRAGPLPMPFMDGDEIIFKLILQPAPTQHTLVRASPNVADRSYRIIWRVGSTANVDINASEL